MHPDWPREPIRYLPHSPKIAVAFAFWIRELVMRDFLSEAAIDLGKVAEHGDFQTVIHWRDEEPTPDWNDASVAPFRTKFWITYDPRLRNRHGQRYEGDHIFMWAKGRFLIAHEMGHSFFYERHLLIDGDLPYDVSGERDFTPFSASEYFCDVFAASLLLPPPLLKRLAFRSMGAYEISMRFGLPTNVVHWMRQGFDKKMHQKNWKYLPELLPLR